jgi:hypothetical protein
MTCCSLEASRYQASCPAKSSKACSLGIFDRCTETDRTHNTMRSEEYIESDDVWTNVESKRAQGVAAAGKELANRGPRCNMGIEMPIASFVSRDRGSTSSAAPAQKPSLAPLRLDATFRSRSAGNGVLPLPYNTHPQQRPCSRVRFSTPPWLQAPAHQAKQIHYSTVQYSTVQ